MNPSQPQQVRINGMWWIEREISRLRNAQRDRQEINHNFNGVYTGHRRFGNRNKAPRLYLFC